MSSSDPDREVPAVEPSAVMRAQRPWRGPMRGVVAECLTMVDPVSDVAIAVASGHHWPNPVAGLQEIQRVARRVVAFTGASAMVALRHKIDRISVRQLPPPSIVLR